MSIRKKLKKPREVTDWTREETIAKMGRLTDAQIALELGLSRERVRQVRNKLGIERRQPPEEMLPAEVYALLGTDRDVFIAKHFGIDVAHVRRARLKRNIPRYLSPCGTRTRYNSGCRCELCTEMNTVAARTYLARLRGDDPKKRNYPAPRTALREDGTPKTLEDFPTTSQIGDE